MHWQRNEEKQSKQISPSKQKANLQKIQQTKASLDETIEELNMKLQNHFQKKQQELIQQYKKQLIQAQKELNQLKSTTNQEQIKNKMLERKKELERERHQLIQTNLFFSTKCEEYKKKLGQLVAQGKQLERELVFLDTQINSTNKRKYQVLASQDIQMTSKEPTHNSAHKNIQQTPVLPLFSDRKPIEIRKLGNSISVRQTNKKVLLQESLAQRSRKNIIKGELPKIVLQKTPLQELFETTVEQVRDRRKGKKNISLKGQEFSEYEKKVIMEQFLSKQEVKKKIYEIIFETEQKKPMLASLPTENKVKISFEDIG